MSVDSAYKFVNGSFDIPGFGTISSQTYYAALAIFEHEPDIVRLDEEMTDDLMFIEAIKLVQGGYTFSHPGIGRFESDETEEVTTVEES